MGAWRRGARLGSLTWLALALGCGESSHDGDGSPSGAGGTGARGGSAGQAPNAGGTAGSAPAGSSGSAGDGAGGTAGAQAGRGGSPNGAGGMSAAAGAPDQATAEYRACADYVRARCKRIAECGVYGESFCLESALPLCPDWIFGPGSNNTPELIAQCATDWMTAPCTVFQTYTPVCIYAPGDFENGEACISDAQCKSGLCSGSDTFCGTCQRVLELGESCADGSTGMCAYGSDCNGTTCVPRRGSALPPGTACETTYLLCATGYVCRADGTGQTTCQEPLAPGATCVDYDCSPYHFCDPATHVCTPNPPAGMPCGDSGIGACAEHAYCNRSADPPVCVVRAALGGTCFDDPDLTDVQGNCEAGLFCVCDAGEDCTDGVCMTRASEGEACGDATTFCVEGTACRSGKCTVSGLAGDYAETCMK